MIFSCEVFVLLLRMFLALSPIRLPTSFAPFALSAGRRGNGQRSSCGCPLLSAFPQKTILRIVYRPLEGEPLQAVGVGFSIAAMQKRKRHTYGGLIVMASARTIGAELCRALRQQAFVLVGGEAVGGEKMQRYGGRSKTP